MAQAETIEAPRRKTYVEPPEPGLTPDEMVARARALIPMLRAQQDEADERGHYGEEVHQAFLKAGLYRAIQPRMFGGYEFSFRDFLRVIIEIGRGHPGTAWCYTLTSSHAMVVAAHFPEEVQAEIFGPEGDFRAPHRAPPTGEFRRVDGGYVVSGRWAYSSGIPVATHFIGGGLIREEGKPPRVTNLIVPRANITILDDWGGDAALGMQGSGSNTVELKEVFVPDRHFFREDILVSSESFPEGSYGTALHGNPLYLGVVGGFFHNTFGGIFVGAARAALDEFDEVAGAQNAYRRTDIKRLQDPDVQMSYGQALTLTDSAEALTLAVADLCTEQCAEAMRTGEPVTVADVMKTWAMAKQANVMACDAIDILFRASPVRAANRGQKMQRYLRDAQMYRIHPSSQPWIDPARAKSTWGMPIGRYGH